MAKTAVPEVGGGGRSGGDKSRWCRHVSRRRMQRIKGPRTIAPDDHVPGTKILRREAKGVKFNGTVIIFGKLSDRNEILNNVWSNENIIKI